MTYKKIPCNLNREKFLSKIILNKENECWNYKVYDKNYGYGIFRIGREAYKAHRVSFLIFNGDLVDGLMIDHICRNRRCCNPDHLRQVTKRINALENNNGVSAENIKKTHCPKGHELKEGNIVNHPKRRHCLICRRKIAREWATRNRKQLTSLLDH